MSGKVAVVDYGMGNLRSVWQALAHVANGREIVVTADPAELRAAERMRAADGSKLKVPHMGWNEVRQARPHPLWAGIEDGARFYFVHSYYVAPTSPEVAVGLTDYGIPFTSAVARDNSFAIQCHPEKSAQAGLALLANFLAWQP